MLTDEQMLDRMKNGWRMGRPFTVCGNGSTLQATANARQWLPKMVAKYGIKSVVDAGAGDMAWIERVEWDVAYTPVDLIPRRPEVAKWDITTELLPLADAILCRHVLNHLAERLPQTVALFKRSGAQYLIATQYDSGKSITTQFQRCDLRPWFGDPLESIQDSHDGLCTLAIWRL
jgi:hypothetical protein